MQKEFRDSHGHIYQQTVEVARGGQGAVYRTSQSGIALKIELDQEGELIFDEKRNYKFDHIRFLPIPEHLNVTLPLDTLESCSGYVMNLLDDMDSFQKAFQKESNLLNLNQWIEELSVNYQLLAKIFSNYITTGGKRRRLYAYYQVACILAELHGNALVFCDFSPNNVFISSDLAYSNVWLIDVDNLNYQSVTKKIKGLFTPDYVAPEVAKGEGCTVYSDVFSFAVALFVQLTGTHPFKGKMLKDLEENNSFEFLDDLLENVDIREFPWILDREDERNLGNTAIPWGPLCSEELWKGFEKTFSESGKKQKNTRTSIFKWCDLLARELDTSVKCEFCNMDYVGKTGKICPWCDHENKIIKVQSFYVQNKVKGALLWEYYHEVQEKGNALPFRLVQQHQSRNRDEILCLIRQEKEGFMISKLNVACHFSILHEDGSLSPLVGRTMMKERCSIYCELEKNKRGILLEVFFDDSQ